MPYKHGVTGSSPVVPTTLKNAQLKVVLFLLYETNARIRRVFRLCALRAPCDLGHTARSLRNASISASLLTSPVVPSSYASFLTSRLSFVTVGCLTLAYSSSPRVHSIPRGPLIFNAQLKVVLFLLYGTIYGREPNRTVGVRKTLALCTVCNFADTLRRFAAYPRFALRRARPVVPASHTSLLKSHYRKRQCSLLCLCVPLPHKYKYLAGSPYF